MKFWQFCFKGKEYRDINVKSLCTSWLKTNENSPWLGLGFYYDVYRGILQREELTSAAERHREQINKNKWTSVRYPPLSKRKLEWPSQKTSPRAEGFLVNSWVTNKSYRHTSVWVCSHGVGLAAQEDSFSPGGHQCFLRVNPVLPLLHSGQWCLQSTEGHSREKGQGFCVCWVQNFCFKAYVRLTKHESTDSDHYHDFLIPSCPGTLNDLVNSGSLARLLQYFLSERAPICAIGHGIAALCCAVKMGPRFSRDFCVWAHQGTWLHLPATELWKCCEGL